MTVAPVALLLLLGQSQDAEALSDKALELARLSRFAEAEKLWQQALALSPNHFSSAYNLGFLYYSGKQYDRAEPVLSRATRANPKDFNAHYILGATLSQLGRSEDALREWRRALALQPDHVKLMQIMAVEYGKGRYFREAAQIAERALGLQTGDHSLYLVAIKSYQDANDHPAALRVATRMIAKFPDSARSNFEYGYELHRAGRREDALPFLKKAMETDQSYEEPFFFYGEVLLEEGRHAEALPPLRKAVELRQDYMAAWVALARALMGLEHYEEAKSELLRAIEVNHRHPLPHLFLSQLYFRLGREELAIQEKELSLRLRRENPEAMESAQSRPFPEPLPPRRPKK